MSPSAELRLAQAAFDAAPAEQRARQEADASRLIKQLIYEQCVQDPRFAEEMGYVAAVRARRTRQRRAVHASIARRRMPACTGTRTRPRARGRRCRRARRSGSRRSASRSTDGSDGPGEPARPHHGIDRGAP